MVLSFAVSSPVVAVPPENILKVMWLRTKHDDSPVVEIKSEPVVDFKSAKDKAEVYGKKTLTGRPNLNIGVIVLQQGDKTQPVAADISQPVNDGIDEQNSFASAEVEIPELLGNTESEGVAESGRASLPAFQPDHEALESRGRGVWRKALIFGSAGAAGALALLWYLSPGVENLPTIPPSAPPVDFDESVGSDSIIPEPDVPDLLTISRPAGRSIGIETGSFIGGRVPKPNAVRLPNHFRRLRELRKLREEGIWRDQATDASKRAMRRRKVRDS